MKRMPQIQERTHRDVLLERAGQVAQVDVSDRVDGGGGEPAGSQDGSEATSPDATAAAPLAPAHAARSVPDFSPANAEESGRRIADPALRVAAPAPSTEQRQAPRARTARPASGRDEDAAGLLEPIGGRQV